MKKPEGIKPINEPENNVKGIVERVKQLRAKEQTEKVVEEIRRLTREYLKILKK